MEDQIGGLPRETRRGGALSAEIPTFRETLLRELRGAFAEARGRHVGEGAFLSADLDCRDSLSARGDLGYERILGVGDSFIKGDELLKILRARGRSAFTITNPASALSARLLAKRGREVLPAAAFQCRLSPFPCRAFVLVYGLEAEDEPALASLAGDLDAFLDRVRSRDLVAVLSRPFEVPEGEPPPPVEWYAHLALRFDTIEVMHGQADLFQCLLAVRWVKSLTPERLEELSRNTGIRLDRFVRRPRERSMTGGSGDRTGLLAGTVWTLAADPGGDGPPSQKLLFALREGRVAPDATFTQEETHAAVLMTRLCELAVHAREPGLLATLAAGETAFDRGVALALTNLFGELRRHQFTTLFLKALLGAFQGKRPAEIIRRLAPKLYRPHIEALDRLALARRHDFTRFHAALAQVLPDLVKATDALLSKKILKNLDHFKDMDPQALGTLEFPSQLRALMAGLPGNLVSPAGAVRRVRTRLRGGLGKVLDDFSFPAIASVFFGALSFAACRNLTRHRAVHRAFAGAWGLALPPSRILWLTDTFHDHNGVSRFLTSLHREAVARGLPIDFLICSSTRDAEPQLKVLRPYCEFRLEKYQDQLVRLPSLLEAHRIFAEGGYDRVVSSTEFPMGLVALYFKYAFHVPAWLYMHTDWLDFARKTLKLGPELMDRGERFFRFLYHRFDHILVLNREHEAWLQGPSMGLAPERVHRTAHWADGFFTPQADHRVELLGVGAQERVLLFAGRISDEKGVFDLPEVWAAARARHPGTRLVFAGTGPAQDRMKLACPDAIWLGWVDPLKLPEIYSSADLLLMPSRFDTFGCVVLEALSCGLPVVAYDSKGPGDIIEHGQSGWLVSNREEMTRACLDYLGDPSLAAAMKARAVERSRAYTAEKIIGGLMKDLHVPLSPIV